jgi:hypothetical protein
MNNSSNRLVSLNAEENFFYIYSPSAASVSSSSLINNSLPLTTIIPSRQITALGAILTFIFITLGLCGNLIILVLILSKRELRSNIVNIFIVSLQLNDIINVGFNCMLVAFSYAFRQWATAFFICEIFVYTSIICMGCTLWHHAYISLNQYMFVVFNKNISKRKRLSITENDPRRNYVIFSLISSRLIPMLVCVPALINTNTTVYSHSALRCLLAPNKSRIQSLLILLVNILVPWAIITFCFSGIFVKGNF